MYYNEPCLPLFSRNPLDGVSQAQNNTFSTSKRSSVTHKPSLNTLAHPSKKRNNSHALMTNKENEECTFEPRVNPDGKKKRSVERFVKDQEEFQRAKERKIQQLRLQINRNEEQSLTGTPQIDRNSKQITASHRSSIRDNIFDRLSRDRSPSNHPHPAPQEYLFSPKILSRSKSIIRNTDVGSLLYDDARRRQEKEQMVVESSRRQIDSMMSPKINKNTNCLVLRKILGEFEELVNQGQGEGQGGLNPVLALSILDEIFNVDLRMMQLAQKVVGVLGDKDTFAGLRTEKVKEFITIVVTGVPHNESKYFTQEEASFIVDNFQFLYKERVTKERKSPTPQKLTFRPKTLASSSKLANSFREKSCQKLQTFLQNQKISNIQIKQGGSFTIEDLFLIDHMKRQTQLQKKKIQRENLQLQQCTFKPDVSTSQSSINLLKKKPKVTLKPSNKAKNIMKTEYTHLETEPEGTNISKIYLTLTRQEKQKRRKKREAQAANLSQGVKDAEKAVMRMSIGRQKREFSQSILQRGYPKNQNWAQYQREMHMRSIENSKKLKGFTSK